MDMRKRRARRKEITFMESRLHTNPSLALLGTHWGPMFNRRGRIYREGKRKSGRARRAGRFSE